MKFKNMKAIIFDMDGVIVDTEYIYLEQLKNFLISKDINIPENILNQIVGLEQRKVWNLLKKYIENKMKLTEFQEKYADYCLEETINYKDLLNPTVVETLEILKKEGYKLSVASSTSLSLVTRILNEIEVFEYFDLILSGEMFKESKPNPEIYLKSAEGLNVKPGECLVVEDSSYGIEAALKAGMFVVAKRDTRFGINQEKAYCKIDEVKEILDLLEK